MNGTGNFKYIGLDSNLFIYNLEQHPQFVKYTDIIFNKLALNKLKAVTSIISLTEILSYPETAKVEIELINDFFNTPNTKIVDVDKNIAIMAAKIRREYGLRLGDAVQLATALVSKAKAFITNDQRLQKFKKIKIILLSEIK